MGARRSVGSACRMRSGGDEFLPCDRNGVKFQHQGLVERRQGREDSGVCAGIPTEMAERLKVLERENRELRQANEILRKASAYFAQAELDRRHKP